MALWAFFCICFHNEAHRLNPFYSADTHRRIGWVLVCGALAMVGLAVVFFLIGVPPLRQQLSN